MLPVLVLAIGVLFLLYALLTMCKPENYPPGPTWLPFVGSSRAVAAAVGKLGSQHSAFEELARAHSTRLLGLKLGAKPVVVALGREMVMEILGSPNFEGRPRNYFLKLRCLGKQIGLTFSDGELWRIHRQFAIKNLKSVGFGKRQMEIEIANELSVIVAGLERKPKAVNLKRPLASAIMNVLWKFTAGESIRDDRRVEGVLSLLEARAKAFDMSGGWLSQLPWLRFICPKWSGYSLICDINNQLKDIISDAIAKHERKQVSGTDFIYEYMKEMEQGKPTFTKEQLLMVCLDLLLASSHTTSSTLRFSFLMILRNPDYQQCIHQEIQTVVGEEPVSWQHHEKMPYTMSFLLEIQRCFVATPVIGPRRAIEDSFVGGYFIPKDTTILLSVHSVHNSRDLWKDPQIFSPWRFIGSQGKLINEENLLTFGSGRRRCPGDSLAKRFIFIMFVGIIQKFSLECSDGVLPPCTPVSGIFTTPNEYTIDFRSRF